MSDIAKLIEEDLSSPARCFFHGRTPLGGTDVCRPELSEDGSVLLRSINLSHTVYRVTEDEYRELREYPQRKVGIWEFVSYDDPDADNVAYATRSPQGAGRQIGSLERALAAKDAEIARLREALRPFAKEADAWADSVPDGHRSLCTEPGSSTAHPGSETNFTVGDIRAARAVLKGASDAP